MESTAARSVRRRRSSLSGSLAGTAVGLLLAGAAAAQENSEAEAAAFPTRSIRIVVPFPAGGPSDVLARLIGQRMTEDWGQAVVIENRPGANTVLAAQAGAARGAGDPFASPLAWLRPIVVAKPVQVAGGASRETFEIPGGGLRIEGRVGNTKIPSPQISFDIYKGSQFEQSERRPLATSVLTGDVVLVPEGTYYILSKYGDGNAVVRSDVRVQAGKLTDIIVTHRAAQIMFKLVSRRGGEALANTDWAVISPAGDTIAESKGAFPRVILAEGEYKVIARNDNKVYQQDLTVIPGVDGEIEVLAR